MRQKSAKQLFAALTVLILMVATGCALAPRASDSAGRTQDHGGSSRSAAGPVATAEPGEPAPMPSDVPAGLRPYYEQKLHWVKCTSGASFQCAALRVPLDYSRPGGQSIELAVLRLPARDRAKRLGSLVINPGGPGGSGVEYAAAAPWVVSKPVIARYDIVGFDPRGVGKSAPVDCLTDKQMDHYLAIDGSPDNTTEQNDLMKEARFFANGCKARSGAVLGHVSTKDAARDMDVLRSALGDKKLTYLGKSYGTFLGATYAGLFPKRAGRLVLDGAIDPTLSARALGLEQAKGFEVALRAFIQDCVSRKDCPLGSSVSEAYRTIDDFLARTDKTPLKTNDPSRKLTQSLAVTGIIMPLYVKEYWPRLRTAMRSALAGNGSGLLALADEYVERNPNGTYRNNSGEAIVAVNCLDRPDLKSVAQARAEQPAFEKASPRFGSYILWGSLSCAAWPFKPTGRPGPIHAKGAPPILVIGTTRDPATPYDWAVRLAKQLDSGVLLTRDGDGHTGYMQGNQCIDQLVDRFLIDGKPPRSGTKCPEG
ncbi:alpha/beta hydrolase [Actinopolymorpha singaporensis]